MKDYFSCKELIDAMSFLSVIVSIICYLYLNDVYMHLRCHLFCVFAVDVVGNENMYYY